MHSHTAKQPGEHVSRISPSLNPLLKSVKVLILTSGHEVTDHRVYAKEAKSLQDFGGIITLVGQSQKGDLPAHIDTLVVPKPSSRLSRFLWQPWRCLWVARRQTADIIHFHDAEMLITLPLAKLWWPRTKFVYDVHEDFGNILLIRDWLPNWGKPALRTLTNLVEKGLASLSDAVVGVTPPLAHKFKKKNRIVAYNFIAHRFFELANPDNSGPIDREFDLVHLGTLSRSRAIFLADVLRQFHQLRPNARSLIIGVSLELSMLLKPIIPAGCVLLEKQPHEKIPRFLSKAKIGIDVHPLIGQHLKVALPVKVCEYMAAGCAVVSSAMPVLTQILDEAKADMRSIIMIEGGVPEDYAQAVHKLLERIDGGEDPGSKLRHWALQHMIWETEAEKIAFLYLNLLGKDVPFDY